MKNKCSIMLIITGTALIMSALFLCLYNIAEDKKSGNKANEILVELKNEIEATADTSETDEFFLKLEEEKKPVSKIDVKGISYTGYITMPSIDIELPIMNDWNYSNLESSPCRYSGNVADKNLVIAAHNYNSHFRKIDGLYSGDLIYFTDTDGKIYEYQVTNIEQISGSDVDAMITDTDESWDLTLFTCTFDGRNRVTVRAVMTEK